MNCVRCGAPLSPNMRFCTKCGAPVGGTDLLGEEGTQLLDENPHDKRGVSLKKDVETELLEEEGTELLEEEGTELLEEEGTELLEEEGTELLEEEGTELLDGGQQPYNFNPVNNQAPANNNNWGGYNNQAPANNNSWGGYNNQAPVNNNNWGGYNNQAPVNNNRPVGGYQQVPANNSPVGGYQQAPVNNSPVGGYQQPPVNAPGGANVYNAAPVGSNYGNNAPKEEKKGGKTGLIIGIVVAIVAVAAAVVVFLFYKGIIKLPGSDKDDQNTTAELSQSDDENTQETAVSLDDTADTTGSDGASVDLDTLLADADNAVESGKSLLDDDSTVLDGISQIRGSLDEYLAQAEAVGYSEDLQKRITDAYGYYALGVEKRLNFFTPQTLSGAVWAQAMSEVGEALDYADNISAAGYSVDTSALETDKSDFDTYYRNSMIETFNEFSTRDAWSRTEAWNLMQDADQMFDDDGDMNDPIRLRYEYALAYHIQKEAETQVNEGTITSKGAAQKIAGVLEATDYNLMLIYEYMSYMEAAGEDYTAVANAYTNVLQHIYDTQNLEIEGDGVYKYWTFNNFDEYKSSVQDGEYNGLTNDNRDFARQALSQLQY